MHGSAVFFQASNSATQAQQLVLFMSRDEYVNKCGCNCEYASKELCDDIV